MCKGDRRFGSARARNPTVALLLAGLLSMSQPSFFHIGDDDFYGEDDPAVAIDRLRQSLDQMEQRQRGLALGFQQDLSLVQEDVAELRKLMGSVRNSNLVEAARKRKEAREAAEVRLAERVDDAFTVKRYLRENLQAAESVIRQHLDSIDARWCVKADAFEQRCTERFAEIDAAMRRKATTTPFNLEPLREKFARAPCSNGFIDGRRLEARVAELERRCSGLLLDSMHSVMESFDERWTQRLAGFETRCANMVRHLASDAAQDAERTVRRAIENSWSRAQCFEEKLCSPGLDGARNRDPPGAKLNEFVARRKLDFQRDYEGHAAPYYQMPDCTQVVSEKLLNPAVRPTTGW